MTQTLVKQSHNLNLTTTFRRAFDAVGNRGTALDSLIDLGIDRVLTSGMPWG